MEAVCDHNQNIGKIADFPPPTNAKTIPKNAMIPPIQRAPKKIDTSLASQLNDGTLIVEDLPFSDSSADVDEESNSAPQINYKMNKIISQQSNSSDYEAETKTESETEKSEFITVKNESNKEIENTEIKLTSEIERLKMQIFAKDKEILTLKEEISEVKTENSELKKEIKSIKEKQEDTKENARKSLLPIFGTNTMKNFKKGKQIGKGTTSEVFEVTPEIKLAIKVLDLEVLDIIKNAEKEANVNADSKNEDIKNNKLKKFLHECQVLNQLDDANILKTYGFFIGDYNEPPVIVQEYCESNLKYRIKELSNEERIKIIVDISSAMKKVHSIGIIHCNLILENILLDSTNTAKLSDFGLHTLIKNDNESGCLKSMSHDILNEQNELDKKIDVYAFGVVVFHILTKGQYQDINFTDTLNDKKAEIPNCITQFSSKLIQDCWSFKSSDRPSFSEICDKLKGNEHKLI